MSSSDPTYREVYDQLLNGLRDSGADQFARRIERMVERGTVLREQYTASSVYRPMEDKEALAVAVEFLVTAVEVPLMQQTVAQILGNDSIEWRLERPGTGRPDELSSAPEGEVEQKALRLILEEILEIAHDLEIELPEVA